MIIVQELLESPKDALIGEMLAMERGYKMQNGTRVKWPTVDIRPKTSDGKATVIHYRPTVGIVYYAMSSEDFDADELVREMSKRLGDLEHDRCTTFATPTSMMVEAVSEPRRTIILSSKYQVSSTASEFTWLFMPVAMAIAVSDKEMVAMADVNAIVASIFFDHGRASKFSHLDQVNHITRQDFHVYDNVVPLAFRGGDSSFLVADGAITLVGDGACIMNDKRRRMPHTLVRVQPQPEAREYVCVQCEAPLDGESVAIDDVYVCRHCWSSSDVDLICVNFIVHRVLPEYSQARIACTTGAYRGIAHLLGRPCQRLSSRGAFYANETLLISEDAGSNFLLSSYDVYDFVMKHKNTIEVIERAKIIEKL